MLKIDNDDINKFKEAGYDGKIYKLYINLIPIHESYGYVNNLPKYSNSNFYVNSSYGTLVCDEDFIIQKYGINNKLEFISKIEKEEPYGVYITDLIADSIIYNKKVNGIIIDYDELLGRTITGQYGYYTSYINGIINTHYKERYKSIYDLFNNSNNPEVIKQLKQSKEYLSYIDERNQYLAVDYSFNPNFKEDYVNDFERDFISNRKSVITYNDKSYDNLKPVIRLDNKLKTNEIKIGFEAYYKLTGNYMFVNSILTIVVSLISYVLSIIKLHNIKPINIIKAKE